MEKCILYPIFFKSFVIIFRFIVCVLLLLSYSYSHLSHQICDCLCYTLMKPSSFNISHSCGVSFPPHSNPKFIHRHINATTMVMKMLEIHQ
uniref:Uncharacterized protein n=1 Tax=Helianthus annuus TaxID=4232 RepID=A0A251U618_HELAN